MKNINATLRTFLSRTVRFRSFIAGPVVLLLMILSLFLSGGRVIEADTGTTTDDAIENTLPAPEQAAKPPQARALMQFRSGGHVLGFTREGVLVAGRDHLLKVSFAGAQAATPEAVENDTTPTPATAPERRGAAPLNEVHYRNLWPGIDLSYDGAEGIVRST